MICQTCKTANADSARFCSGCGAELRNVGASADSSRDEITRQQQRERSGERNLVDTPRDRLLSATIAGKYRLVAKLGAGGMGTVYRAERLLIGDEVAVKILHSEQNEPRAAERFRREAQAAARLRHPNAVAVYDFGVTDEGLQYLVMELVDGESLRQIIKQQGPVTPSAAADIMNQVCAALDEAHRHGVLHRDLKPDNIVVSVTDAGVRVKVLDFGIAKLRDDAAGNLTQTGSILGTPHYMSPEQCMGEELDSRSDIYSLGIVLYEMLTGVVPFRSPSSPAVVVQHVNQPPPSPRALNASISVPVEMVLLHALAKSREARPQSAGALAQEFASAVKGGFAASAATGSFGQDSAAPPTIVVNSQSQQRTLGSPRTLDSGAGARAPSHTIRIVGLSVLGTLLLLGLGGLGVRFLFGARSETPASNASVLQEPSPAPQQSARVPQAPSPRPQETTTPDAPPPDTSLLVREVRSSLEGWAGAARAHDLDLQMTYYAETVDPYYLRRQVSAADVRANRAVAYSRYSKLDIQLSNIDVVIDSTGTQATATFDKFFAFEGEKNFSGSVRSVLSLTKSGSRWLISGERDVKVYYVNK